MSINTRKELAFHFTNSLAGHPLFNQYFQTVDDFLAFTGFEEKTLEDLFNMPDEQVSKKFEGIGSGLYTRYQPPFIDITHFLDFAVGEVRTSIHKQQLDLSQERLDRLQKLMQNAIAKSYFFHTLDDFQLLGNGLHDSPDSPMGIHYNWLKSIVAYLEGKQTDIPETDHLSCGFARWLKSLQCELFLAATDNERSRHHARIYLAHRKIHQQFSYVLSFIEAGEFMLALSHLLILHHTVLELEQHIRSLEANYKDNEENNFYNFIDIKSAEEEELYYFISVRIAKWGHLMPGSMLRRDYKLLRQKIESFVYNQGMQSILYFSDNDVRIFVKKHESNISPEQINLLAERLHDLIESYATSRGMRVRTIGIKLDYLNAYPEHKIAMLKQLPELGINHSLKMVSTDETDDLYSSAIEAQAIALFADEALNSGTLDVFFQPILQPNNSDCIHAEALVRVYKDGIAVDAEKFLGYFESQDKMDMLDLFVLGKIRNYVPQLKKVIKKLSINIYPTSFRTPNVVKSLIELSNVCNDNDMQLIVEITEQVFLGDTTALESLAHDHGIVFSLDDFGSGYSNLIQLIELAELGVIKVLKIDGGLVKHIDEDEKVFKVIETITEIASTLNLTPIIMEYVSTQNILEKLEELHSDLLYQGYYLDPPLPINNLLERYVTPRPTMPLH